MRTSQQQSALFAAAMGLILALGACNTAKGIGEDVEDAGEGIQETAEDVEGEL
jgi:predicted small secreted protein